MMRATQIAEEGVLRDMGNLIVVVGLPGSGKSSLLKSLRPFVEGVCTSDFMKNAEGGSRDFERSRHFAHLIEDLRAGRTCVVDDITFCEEPRRQAFQSVVNGLVREMRWTWFYFTNDLVRCEENIITRDRPSWREEVAEARRLSKKYLVPSGAIELRCFQPSDTA